MKPSLVLPLHLLRQERRLLAHFISASVGRAALTGASILLIREFLGGVLGRQEGMAGWVTGAYGPNAALGVLAALLLLVTLGTAGLTYASKVTQQKLVKVLELGIMERLIRKLLQMSAGFFDRRTRGDLIQTVQQDVTHLRSVAVAAANLLLESLQAAALVCAAVILSPRLALWAFLLVPVAVGPVYLIAQRTLSRSFGIRRRSVVLFDMLFQLLGGIRIIKVYHGERAEADRAIDRARRYFDELIAMERVRALARVVIDSLAGFGLIVVIIVGGLQVLAGTLGWPELLAFLMAVRATHTPVNNLNTNYLEIQRHGASVAQIDALLRERPEVADRPDAGPLEAPPRSIAGDRLSFSAGPVTILDEVSFDVRAGETLGVVGASGAGKTTLLNLIARFYDPRSGAVLYDGADIRRIRLDDVQRQLAFVTQEPFLFSTSIRENIRCGRPEASDAEVAEAARAAEIHDEIAGMPDGYETPVGHGGRTLSRGEAQRVNIARAILKNAPVLLLDEATSSLDSHTEASVQRAIDRLVTGRLTISVAHRLSTLHNASRILVLEKGRAVGLGSHDDLLERCVAYRRLWEAQARPRGAAVSEDEPGVRPVAAGR